MSDGNFKWWYAGYEDSEHWVGPKDSREAAITAGRAEYGAGETFWICEADKAEYSFSGLFDGDDDHELAAETLTIDLDYVDSLLTRWSENEEAMGEDGWEDDGLTEEDKAGLLAALIKAQATDSPDPENTAPRADAMSNAFEEWAETRRADFGEVYMFGRVRRSEKIEGAS